MLKTFNIFDKAEKDGAASERAKLNLGRLIFIVVLVLGYLFFLSAEMYKTIAGELVKIRADVSVIKEELGIADRLELILEEED